MFLDETNNAPEVREMFKAQLNAREEIVERKGERKSKHELTKKIKEQTRK